MRFLHSYPFSCLHYTRFFAKNQPSDESFQEHPFHDFRLRHNLHFSVYLLWKQYICYLCSGEGGLRSRWIIPAYRRIFPTLHDVGDYSSRNILWHGTYNASCHHQYNVQLPTYTDGIMVRFLRLRTSRNLVVYLYNQHYKRHHYPRLVPGYKEENTR